MKIFGIFGDPINHSLSPAMQNAALRALGEAACYHAFRVRQEKLEDAILGAAAMGFGGLNLTIPLKEKALKLPILQPDELARAIGAVNTISFCEDNRNIVGYNTDGEGALMALRDAGVRIKDSKVLLIGAGGAAKAIAYTLEQEGARISIANRSIQKAQHLAACVNGSGFSLDDLGRLVPGSDIVINATSVGMKEDDTWLFDSRLLNRDQTVFDIVYNRDTKLLQDARTAGARAIDGVMMLVYQGAKALEIWTGKKAPVGVMERAVRESLMLRQAEAEKETRETREGR